MCVCVVLFLFCQHFITFHFKNQCFSKYFPFFKKTPKNQGFSGFFNLFSIVFLPFFQNPHKSTQSQNLFLCGLHSVFCGFVRIVHIKHTFTFFIGNFAKLSISFYSSITSTVSSTASASSASSHSARI